jgi:ketosteroid isomerase-like protein
VIEVVWSGTHAGPLLTPDGGTITPSGQPISVPAAMVLTMRGGTISRMAHYFDLTTLLTQVGALPALQAA